MKTITKILVPLDFSPHSTSALDFAADLALRCNATLYLLHVFDPAAYVSRQSFMIPPPDQLDGIRTDLDGRLQAAKRQALAAGVISVDTTLIEDAHPSAAIERMARSGAFDLVVMGTHGRTGIRHLAVGSVAEGMVRRSPCPVLTVRAQSAE